MPNENVTPEDIQATAAAKAEEVKEAAAEKVEDAKAKLDGLSTNKKVLLSTAAAVIVSVVVSKAIQRFRAVRVNQTIVVSPDEVEEVL